MYKKTKRSFLSRLKSNNNKVAGSNGIESVKMDTKSSTVSSHDDVLMVESKTEQHKILEEKLQEKEEEGEGMIKAYSPTRRTRAVTESEDTRENAYYYSSDPPLKEHDTGLMSSGIELVRSEEEDVEWVMPTGFALEGLVKAAGESKLSKLEDDVYRLRRDVEGVMAKGGYGGMVQSLELRVSIMEGRVRQMMTDVMASKMDSEKKMEVLEKVVQDVWEHVMKLDASNDSIRDALDRVEGWRSEVIATEESREFENEKIQRMLEPLTTVYDGNQNVRRDGIMGVVEKIVKGDVFQKVGVPCLVTLVSHVFLAQCVGRKKKA